MPSKYESFWMNFFPENEIIELLENLRSVSIPKEFEVSEIMDLGRRSFTSWNVGIAIDQSGKIRGNAAHLNSLGKIFRIFIRSGEILRLQTRLVTNRLLLFVSLHKNMREPIKELSRDIEILQPIWSSQPDNNLIKDIDLRALLSSKEFRFNFVEQNINLLSQRLKENRERFFNFYSQEIRNRMPEYTKLEPAYNDPISAYAYFFGCLMDQAPLSADLVWKNIRKLKQTNQKLFDPINLLDQYPESPFCKETKKAEANCPAKHFLDDHNLQFSLGVTHKWFRAAHFLRTIIQKFIINSILDLPDIDRYQNAKILYEDLRKNTFKAAKVPKTLSLAFRIMTENAEGRPSGKARFWDYNEEQLANIPMPVDFWIAFFSFKCGLIEPSQNVDNEIIAVERIKPILLELWNVIGRKCGIPHIFLDPSLWKIAGENCVINECSKCFFKSIGYDCPKVSKVHRISSKRNGRIYYLFWSNVPLTSKVMPEGFQLELGVRK